MKRLATAALVAGVIAVVAGCGAPRGGPIVGSGPETSYTPPPITWSKCTNSLKDSGGECGFLEVPLDYAQPDGPKIKLAVSRISHTVGPDDYQGVAVVNLTSPGSSGLTHPAFSKVLPESISGDYDWVGFDSRGVGSSQPALSCDHNFNAYDRPSYLTTTAEQQAVWLKRVQDYSAACARTNSPLLRHVTTTDSVQDLDSLRKALGQGQLNYYGYWYGAYLGEVYSTMYPGRVRRMVLDSSIDPKQAWYGFNLAQNAAADQNFSAFSAWVATHDDVYHLGTTEAAVKQQYYAAMAKLTKEPVDGSLGPTVLTDAMLLDFHTMYWIDLAKAFSTYINQGDALPLKSLLDTNYPPSNDNLSAMSLAIECTDATFPRDWDTWLKDTQKSYETAPFSSWANTWFIAGCQSWSVPAQKPAVVDGSHSPATLMLLDSTLQPSTTYAGSLAVRKLFPKAALAHSGATPAVSDADSSCSIGPALVAYLHDGTMPARVAGDTADVQCTANPLPDPASASGPDANGTGR
ncbi:MAG TPA: alpha/beta hydrolase [Pseudonocardia sp.]|uniref:alpha/beta hydrolase n=1 Tax=Pseudonocardia sp. TaxID=60912 RepID=UPI002D1AC6EA|nr:alpha/beta hydrolase [Pseudonocardia sp.]HTF51352.1 alpha/beta hydrolase [Pseudonocardia sp.]